MKVSTIKYTRKINLGNYEHEELTAEAILDENESPTDCIAALKELVLNNKARVESIPELPLEDKGLEEEAETLKAEKPKKEKAKKEPKKKAAEKNIPYDRTKDLHVNLLKSALNDHLGPEWTKKSKWVTAASEKHMGKDFLSPDGEVLGEFMTSFIAEQGR